MKIKSVFNLFCLTIYCSCVFCFTVSAATLNIDDDGSLLGAYDVMVDGIAYDVVFMEGTGEDLFYQGSEWVFAFTNLSRAKLASQALADTVFIDSSEGNFDSQPELTYGIEDVESGRIYTTFGSEEWGSMGTYLRYSYFKNSTVETADNARGNGSINATADTLGTDNRVYAVWTEAAPVPIPGAVWLLGSGFLGLIGIRRRAHK